MVGTSLEMAIDTGLWPILESAVPAISGYMIYVGYIPTYGVYNPGLPSFVTSTAPPK